MDRDAIVFKLPSGYLSGRMVRYKYAQRRGTHAYETIASVVMPAGAKTLKVDGRGLISIDHPQLRLFSCGERDFGTPSQCRAITEELDNGGCVPFHLGNMGTALCMADGHTREPRNLRAVWQEYWNTQFNSDISPNFIYNLLSSHNNLTRVRQLNKYCVGEYSDEMLDRAKLYKTDETQRQQSKNYRLAIHKWVADHSISDFEYMFYGTINGIGGQPFSRIDEPPYIFHQDSGATVIVIRGMDGIPIGQSVNDDIGLGVEVDGNILCKSTNPIDNPWFLVSKVNAPADKPWQHQRYSWTPK